jgi:hypothetical protein
MIRRLGRVTALLTGDRGGGGRRKRSGSYRYGYGSGDSGAAAADNSSGYSPVAAVARRRSLLARRVSWRR